MLLVFAGRGLNFVSEFPYNVLQKQWQQDAIFQANSTFVTSFSFSKSRFVGEIINFRDLPFYRLIHQAEIKKGVVVMKSGP